MENFFIDSGCLDVLKHYNNAYNLSKVNNFGALVSFNGIVRNDGICSLSFDIYEPILKKWFFGWEQKAKNKNCLIYFAHSVGDVDVAQSSYFVAVMSRHRNEPLSFLGEFVEDFKKHAPIWKYDIINGEKHYAKDRSFTLLGAGCLKPNK